MAAVSGSNNEIVVLTEVVREQYVRYLERQLQENVSVWASASRNHHKPTAWACIEHSVKELEARAIKASQAVQLYQRAMVKMISAVRRNTQECRLADTLFDYMQHRQKFEDEATAKITASSQCSSCNTQQQQPLVDKSTQTAPAIGEEICKNNDNYTSVSLRQKIDLFQTRLAKHESTQEQQIETQSNQQQTKAKVNEEISTPMSETEDAIGLELAKIFDDEPNDLNAIFGIEIDATTDNPDLSCASTMQLKPEASPASPLHTLPNSKDATDLRQSRWPCELYAHRRQLSTCLVRLLDLDWRCEDVLRYKFHLLFGEDSDDEFSTHVSSPSIDLVDEVLLASCILRIRPWIVRHLMPPLQEGLIANRFLFKKLAKLLATNIVLVNPYASERQVMQAVEHMFCNQPRGVQSALDLESLPTVFIERFES